MRRSVLVVLALAAFHATAAVAQQPQPWSGIVANEARPSTGQQYGYGSNEVTPHAMSADGRFVVFDSNVDNLVYGDYNGWNDVFLRDRQTGELTIVSRASDGTLSNSYSAWPTISANGRYIAFYSCATNLVPNDTDPFCDLFIRDRELGTTIRASVGPNGDPMPFASQHAYRLSGDGRYLVFVGRVTADLDVDEWEVWLRDRDADANGIFDEPGTSTTTRISPDVLLDDQLGAADEVAISNDGRWIAYGADTYSPTWGSVGTRMYLHDRDTGTTGRVDRAMAGGIDMYAYSTNPDFSESGHLAYSSTADNLTEGDTDGNADVFVFNIITGGNSLIQLTYPGAPDPQYAWSPAISADGRYVAFTGAWFGGWNFQYNIFAVDRQTGASYPISVRWDGSLDNTTGAPSISADGSSILFHAGPEMLVWGWGNTGVFVATNFDVSPSEIDVPSQGGTVSIDVAVPDGIAWALTPPFATGLEVSQSSGVGPATIDVTVNANTENYQQDYAILLGSKQVTLHQPIAPHLYWVDPWEGSPVGGTDVVVHGENFADGATVTFDGVPATNVVFIDSSAISATTPAHAIGFVDVTVTNPGGASATFQWGFNYVDTTPPVVTYEVEGTLGQNGWYTSDVRVTFHYDDPESPISPESTVCPSPFVMTEDSNYAFAICNVLSEGGRTVVDVDVKRDTVPPVLVLGPPYGGETYVLGEQLPLAVYCADSTSGVPPQNCTANQNGQYLDTSTAGTFTLTGTAVDLAGHATTTSVNYTVKIPVHLTVPVATAVYGTPTAALRATMDAQVGGPVAGKTITFYVDNIAVGTGVTGSNGEAIFNFPIAGLNAGSHEMHADFPGDGTTFPMLMSSALTISPATPLLTWANPSFITAGTPLSSAQLNAVSNVPGTFLYEPGAGTVLAAGTYSLSVVFTPDDTTNYIFASTSVTLKVKGVPAITWGPPPPIRINQTLTSAQLNATADVPGTFVYTPGLNWNWNVVGPQTVTVTFTPANTADYTSATASNVVEVLKGIPTINFPPSDSISYTAALSATQLNATSQVTGTFTYNPPAGTLLPVGTHIITATLTPNDLTRWEVTSVSKSQVIYKADPVVRWDTPAEIPYGTPLGPAQQNATSSVPGTFTYYPAPGTLLEVGQHWMSVSLHPEDTANYNNGSTYVSINVGYGVSAITWSNPAPIVYGQPLTSTQLNATASVPGTFTYTPATGTILTAGTRTLHVTFTPTDSSHYASASKDVTIVVGKRTPTITWTAPAGITYGAALSGAQLNATSNVAGTFSYSPAAGTVLPVGTHPLSVTFTPTDTANNLSATTSVSITVSAATPVISWANPSSIVYGAVLTAAQLNATANVPGSFEYSPAPGTVLAAGTQTLSVTFTPDDATSYTSAIGTASIVVTKGAPSITWPSPTGITYGTALSAAQLNATASVPGTFVYTPAAGTVLDAGNRTLSATFTPDDAANYSSATLNVSIAVAQATPVVSWPEPAGIIYGTLLSATQLNATANVAGTFAYSPGTGYSFGAGTHALSVTFTPTDTSNYATATATATLIVSKATPLVSWSTPAAITYGGGLSYGGELNATANVPGTFVYSPPVGTVLNAGTNVLSVTFTPADPNYNTAAASVTLIVNKATPVLSWAQPPNIQYGTALSSTQLNATANVAGTFSYSPAAGTVPAAGGATLIATFMPADPANYNTPASISKTIFVAPVPLTLQVDSASKVYGQPLPAFSATGTGFVNGDTIASLSGTPTFSTSATATSATGSYSISLTGISSTNYTLTVQQGTLTVTKAATSLTLTTTPNPSNNNQTVQLRAVISAVAPGAGTATGTVEFRENGTLLSTATLVNGVATMNKSFKRGTHPLTATYLGDANFTGSTGNVSHQTQ